MRARTQRIADVVAATVLGLLGALALLHALGALLT